MIQIKMFLKALKLRRKLKRLKLAKENTFRIEQGLEPIVPFTDKLRAFFIDIPSEFIYKAFCPCCVYDRYRHLKGQRPIPESACGRLTYSGTYENQVFKSCIGFTMGVFLNYCLYLYMVYQLRMRMIAATVWCLVLGNVLTLGLALSDTVRCVVMLVIPSLFSSKGRTALLAMAMVMTFNGPVMNAGENAMRLADTIQCGQELLKNTTKEVIKEALTPVRTIYKSLKAVMKQIIEFGRKVKRAFMAVVQIFRDIMDTIKQVFGWLARIVEECNEKIGTPAKKCYKSIDDAVERCKVALGWFFSWLCYIAHVGKVACAAMSLIVALCNLPTAISENIIEPIKQLVKGLVRKIKEQIYVDIKFNHHMNYTFEQSKSMTDIRKEIINEIKERVDLFDFTLDLADFLLFSVFFLVIFKAWSYRRKYLTKDRFDNAYITFTVRDIDERRGDMGKETLLPLRLDEKRKYIKTNSWGLAFVEKKKLFTSLVLFLSPAMQTAFYMFADYTLYWLLRIIQKYGSFDAELEIPADVEIHVRGNGFLASMYRTIIKSFSPLLKLMPVVDTSPCLPIPSRPDYAHYKKIIAIYGLVLVFIVFEAYALRLRHVICSWFHPNREKERAVWLYNDILKKRGGIVKLMRRRLREKYGADKFTKSAAEKSGMVEYLATNSSCLKSIFKFFGYTEKKYCIVCATPGFQEDYETFKHCQSPGCQGVYCNACFLELDNQCTLCLHPIEYGDASDISEELDSSDEEEILRKREEARMRAEQKTSSIESDFELDSQDSQVDAADLLTYAQKMVRKNEMMRQQTS